MCIRGDLRAGFDSLVAIISNAANVLFVKTSLKFGCISGGFSRRIEGLRFKGGQEVREVDHREFEVQSEAESEFLSNFNRSPIVPCNRPKVNGLPKSTCFLSRG
jgi:hypothetical protein